MGRRYLTTASWTSKKRLREILFSNFVQERLKDGGLFEGIKGVLFGKPQVEAYFEEYKAVVCDVLVDDIPILYNINFGHAYPKMSMQYGAMATVDAEKQLLKIERL